MQMTDQGRANVRDPRVAGAGQAFNNRVGNRYLVEVSHGSLLFSSVDRSF
jgi:hypothetical protein